MDSRSGATPATMDPPRHAVRVATGRGEIAVWPVSPQIYATQASGYMSPEMARLIIRFADPMYPQQGVLQGFHDWFRMDNYDSTCRVELTAWVLRRRAQSALQVGVASRMVAMGVSVANLALGNLIHVHNSMDALVSAFTSAQRKL